MISENRRVAVVTGANRGIGFVVVLGSRDEDRGRRAAESIGVIARALDVSDDRSVTDAAAWIGEELGRCDALVNNAAILYDTWGRAERANLDEVRAALETNLLGAWRTTLALLPLLKASPSGRIVNVSSESGSLASMGAGTPAYHVSKAALNALTRTLAGELRGDGILVNAICPGWTATDMGGSGGRPVSEGAASVVWGVTLPTDGPTGGFFRDGRELAW
jgi:NAD(P)-dependent dehydrogenase (short-subunit alcohol dehydrogenase family)